MNDVEEMLRRTLGSASQQAPRMPTHLPAQLEASYRRRRRRNLAQVVLAAAAVVVVAAGTTAVLRHGDTTATTLSPSTSRPDAPVWPLPEPVARVWPEAVHKVPARGPGGTKLMPQTFIDDRTVLVTTWGGFEKTDALYAYDLVTHDLREITDVPTPAGTVLFASDFTVGEGRVVWWTATKDARIHVWTAPLSGGDATTVADLEAGTTPGLDGLAVEGDRILFSPTGGGVFTVPAAGGAVQAVPGGEGMHLLKWPWVGSPGAAPEGDGTRFITISNVETGETSVAVRHNGEHTLACGVRLCAGVREGRKSFYRLRDGSQEKELPMTDLSPDGLARERFLVAMVTAEGAGHIPILYDVSTGTAADLGVRARGGRLSIPGVARDGRLVSYQVGDDLYVVDLAKIG
ncbi:hypothetical protein GCM10009850_098810 [Nonomuraea monospora]|uniref:WD40 repeat domain-containing protein n=1 Tax=Nonomuraea monospora TaxID=568818 RepID=A0ABN3CY70_9ACTN